MYYPAIIFLAGCIIESGASGEHKQGALEGVSSIGVFLAQFAIFNYSLPGSFSGSFPAGTKFERVTNPLASDGVSKPLNLVKSIDSIVP